jgi:large repetitive protein
VRRRRIGVTSTICGVAAAALLIGAGPGAGVVGLGAGSVPTATSVTLINTSALSIDDVAEAEGNGGTTAFTFTITRSGDLTLPASVDFATADDTATQPGDYAENSGTLNFAAGEATKTVTVLVNGDTTVEPDETFTVNLSNATGATIGDPLGLGTIENDDTALAIDNVMLAEGNSGTTAFVFTVRKTGAAVPASVDFATANGTATSASDYMNATGTVNFAGGDATKTITVLVNGDTTFETDETFFVTLSNANGATIADNQAESAIANDDTAPTLAVNDVTMAEGNSGTTAFTFLVTKTGPTELSASVAYATANGTAIAPDDYAAQSGMLIFAAGDTSKLVTVLVSGETDFESNEDFFVNLSIPGGATLADNQGQATIVNDDGTATLAINDVIRAEGDSDIAAFTFTITKSSTNSPATVDFATTNGTASAPDDYAAWAGTLSFAATETSKTVTMLVNGDTAVELDETFFVNLANASGATIADNQGQGTIQNDDTVTRPPIGTRPCVVPKVKKKTLAKARRLLAEKRCALGKVTYAYSRKVKKGRIISESKRPGTRHRRGTKVNVVVSRGPRKSSKRDDE